MDTATNRPRIKRPHFLMMLPNREALNAIHEQATLAGSSSASQYVRDLISKDGERLKEAIANQ